MLVMPETTDQQAIAILRQLGPREITISDIRKAFGVQYGDHHAKRLIRAGLLRKLGHDRYILTPEGGGGL
jgi:hypothetical protein